VALTKLIELAMFISSNGAKSGTLDKKVLAWLYLLIVFTDDTLDPVVAVYGRTLLTLEISVCDLV
jgi:hypothetical protein